MTNPRSDHINIEINTANTNILYFSITDAMKRISDRKRQRMRECREAQKEKCENGEKEVEESLKAE